MNSRRQVFMKMNKIQQNIIDSSGRFEKEKEYWLQKLGNENVPSVIPADFKISISKQYEPALIKSYLDVQTSKKVLQICRESEKAALIFLITGVFCLLYKYEGRNDHTIGMPVLGKTLGGVINRTLAIRTKINGSFTYSNMLNFVKQTVSEAVSHQNYPFEKIEALLYKQNMCPSPIFSTAVLLKNIQLYENIDSFKPDTIFEFFIENEIIGINLIYNSCLYCNNTIEKAINHLSSIFTQAVKNPEIKIAHIDILTSKEKNELFSLMGQQNDFSRTKTVYHYLEEHAKINGEKPAVIFGNTVRSYKDLNQGVNRFAKFLIAKGIKSEDLVVIFMERSDITVQSILSVWKAGGAYIPIDTSYPVKRVCNIINDSGAKFVVTFSKFNHPDLLNKCGNCEIINLDTNFDEINTQDTENLNLNFDINKLSYIIYTSGSTGKPKGAMVEHLGMMNHISSKIHDLQITEKSIISQNASHCFDISVWQFFTALVCGGHTVVYDNNLAMNPQLLVKNIIKDNLTILEVVPSFLSLLLDTFEESPVTLNSLQQIIITGETLNPSLVRRWFSIFPGILMVNAYGPTEASDDITHYIMSSTPQYENLPIGKPIQNLNIYIVDRDMNLCPRGMKGEICVSGIGVGRGYINDEPKTLEVFMQDPYRPLQNLRLYKTGDMGRWLPDGNIEFFGRKDSQVKINGFRIELGEIENKLYSVKEVSDAAVIDRQDEYGKQYLCAYYTTRVGIKPYQIKELLKKELPIYMLPSFFIKMDELPLTPNGKVNKKSLPLPQYINQGVEFAAPQNSIQEKIQKVWKDVLSYRDIGIHDDFFDMGGNSIKAIQVTSKLSKHFEISVNDIFTYKTINELAKNINPKQDNLKTRIDLFKKKIMDFDETSLNLSIKNTILEYRKKNQKYNDFQLSENTNYTNILLTGSTGFLGVHLLRQLLYHTNAYLHLIIRGKSIEDAIARLHNTIKYHFNEDFSKKYYSRIIVYKGDMTEKNFGLSDIDYKRLSLEVDCILNPAANVRHYGEYNDLYKVNTLGPEKLILLALTGKSKHLHHVSTMGIASGNVKTNKYSLFTEYDLDIGQEFENYYVKSKFEAEKLITEERKKGLNANIYRVGNLVFDSSTGIFQKNIEENAFYNVIRSLIKLEQFPDIRHKNIDFSFIERTAEAIVLLLSKKELINETFHVYNPNYIAFKEIGELLVNSGYKVEISTIDNFFDNIYSRYISDENQLDLDNIFLQLNVFGNRDETFFHTECTKTEFLLQKLGFSWPEIKDIHIKRMMEHCCKKGFL